MNPNERIRELINAWCSGHLDDESLLELEDRLRQSPDARRLFLEYRATESALRSASLVRELSPQPDRRRWKDRALAGLAVAVVALLGCVLLLWPSRSDKIATVSGKAGAVLWTGDGGQISHDLDSGTRIGGGTLETLAGDSWSEIEFDDGTTVVVSGRSAITISQQQGRKILRLREGAISVDAAEQPAGAPMVLTTPSAEARVLGTQFNVSADEFATRVTVNEGVVEVERLADGSVQQVAENHLIVAALERETEFRPVPRREFIEFWKSDLPHGLRHGEWRPAADGLPGALEARPFLCREDSEETLLLHVAGVDPSPNTRPPVLMTGGSRLRVRGRLGRSHIVYFGFETRHPGGGFAGKYGTSVTVEPDHHGGNDFEIELPVERFERNKEQFPPSPLGLELADFWALTAIRNVGLEIISVELLK